MMKTLSNEDNLSRSRSQKRVALICLLAVVQCSGLLHAQAAPTAGTDVLIFTDGEKLIGHFVGASGASVTFKSDAAGVVTVDWAKVKELHSADKFAVAPKGTVFSKHDDLSKIPQGTVSVTDSKIEITPAAGGLPPATMPVADAQNVIPQASFLRAFQRPKFTDYWHGSAGLGLAIVAATQNSRSLTTALSLVRTVPNEDWINPRYRTTIDFNSAYGQLSQTGQPTVKTDIINAAAEQDQYLSKKLFAYGSAAFDHSLSQGLKLQQTYGLGLGYTVFKTKKHELDLKGEVAYISQTFEPLTVAGVTTTLPSKHLVGAVISETYNRSFYKGITLHEQFAFTPAFNDTSAYSTLALVNLSIPVYKRLAFTIGTVDSYLNEPPVGFKKNSFQLTTNISYTIN